MPNPTQQEVRDAFQELYDGLTEAYWSASTIEAKDRIYGVEEIVFDILTALDQEALKANTDTFKQAAKNMKSVIAKLDELKESIDQIIHAVKIAGNVARFIDQAIKQASKFFAL